MEMDIKDIERNYIPVWEGYTDKEELKRIFVIIGPYFQYLFRPLHDIDFNTLLDSEGYELLIPKDYMDSKEMDKIITI